MHVYLLFGEVHFRSRNFYERGDSQFLDRDGFLRVKPFGHVRVLSRVR